MTTLSRSIQMASGDCCDELEIAGIIICLRMFIGEESDMLTVVIGDAYGKVIEAKTWSMSKAHLIYRKFNEGDSVILSCPIGSIMQPDLAYSNASYETYYWTLFNCDDIVIKSYMQCYTDIDAFHSSYKKVKTLAGLLVEKGEGPLKYDSQNKVVARGHFIKLKDTNDRIFRALVWECVGRGYRSALNSCNTGDCILLLFAREQEEYYRPETPRIYTVTTSYPPIVDSRCIAPTVYLELSEASEDCFCEQYNPYIKPFSGYLCF